jgi:hypothetical protein
MTGILAEVISSAKPIGREASAVHPQRRALLGIPIEVEIEDSMFLACADGPSRTEQAELIWGQARVLRPAFEP